MDEWLSAGQTARYLGVSTRTLRRYTERGLLPDHRSPGGRRVFRRSDLDRLKGFRSASRVVAYGRVSSRRQEAEGDLTRQVERLVAGADAYSTHPDPLAGVFTDVASGLSDRRLGLKRALTACMSPDVATLLVTHPDRLARCGVGMIEHLLSGFSVQVACLGEEESTDPTESELVRDMLAIVASFAGRLYGQRSAKARRLEAAVRAEVKNDAC